MPVAALPDLVRTAGVFLSQADVRGLLAHVQFLADSAPPEGEADFGRRPSSAGSGTQERGAPPARSVDLETFLQLLLCHRPAVEVTQACVEAEIRAAFATLAPATGGVLDAQQLVELLQSGGEPMPRDELAQVLAALTGSASPAEALPPAVDAAAFLAMLGLEAAGS